MNLILTNLYIFLMAIVLAVLEIQIEGEHGWAKNLPTWRPKNHNWATQLYVRIMSGKELTGYHLSMFGFVFLIFQLPYFFGHELNWYNFAQTLSLYLIFMSLWDFIWFVLNPHYPLKYFKRDNPIHNAFFLGLPVDYWFSFGISLAVVILASFLGGYTALLGWWAGNVALFIIETLLLILFSLNVLKIDNWIK